MVIDLDLPSDPAPAGNPCTDCGLCVERCPARALDAEGKTDVMKCIRRSQPYGLSEAVAFWIRHADASPDARKAMFKDDHFWRMYQAGHIGPQYFCFQCMSSCPVGQPRREGGA